MQGLLPFVSRALLSASSRLHVARYATAAKHAMKGLEEASVERSVDTSCQPQPQPAHPHLHDFRPGLHDLELHVFNRSKPRLLEYLLRRPGASRCGFASNIEWLRALGLDDDEIVRKLYASASAIPFLRSVPLVERLQYFNEVLGCNPRTAVGTHWDLLLQDLSTIDQKVYMLERHGMWDDMRGAPLGAPALLLAAAGGAAGPAPAAALSSQLGWAALPAAQFCKMMGFSQDEFAFQRRAWANSQRVHKYHIVPPIGAQ